MNPIEHPILACIVVGIVSLLTGCDGYETSTTPTVSGHSDGLVYAAAVALDGNISFRTLASPTEETGWERVSSSTRGEFAPDTAPILLRHGNDLLLFARGSDDNLWETSRSANGDWLDWMQLTDTGDVRGRFAITLTGSTPGTISPGSLAPHFDPRPNGISLGDSVEYHVIHVSGNGSVTYRALSSGGAQEAEFTWSDALEGTIGSDEADKVVTSVRRSTSIDIQEANRSSGWTIEPPITIDVPRGTLDLSNVVHYRDQYHFFYVLQVLGDDVANDIRTQVRHARYTPSPEGPQVRAYIFDRSIDSERDPWPVLADYRNKLVVVYVADGGLHYARWDNATGVDESGNFPWVGRFQAGGSTFVRPAVGFHARTLSPNDQFVPNFGNDLFVATKFPSPPFDEGSVRIRDFSQSIFRKEIDREFAVFFDEDDIGCTAAKEDPLDRIFLPTEQRPYLSELGYLLWTLPSWISDGGLHQVANDLCTSGQWTEANTGGRVKPPCAEANLPMILKPSSNIYVCQGAWNQIGHSYFDLFQEVGHYAVGQYLGLSDDGSVMPAESALPPNGPDLATYNQAASIFSERVGANCSNSTMAGTGRCRGFTGFANNYDTGSLQHSFIYAWYYYFVDGDRLRDFVAADNAVGDDLLQRKYDWIRDHIYRGEEFGRHNEPVSNMPP